MRVQVAFTPAEAASAPVGIVVDVLRATSTIAQALASGYERVYCMRRDRGRAWPSGSALGEGLLGGERSAVQDRGLRRRRLAARVPRRAAREDGDLLDDERDARDPRDGGALGGGAAREPAQPRRGRGRRPGAWGGRGRRLRRLPGAVRARRRLLRRAGSSSSWAASRRTRRRRRRRSRAPGRMRTRRSSPARTARPASRRTSLSARR